jgi:hypothetical protein
MKTIFSKLFGEPAQAIEIKPGRTYVIESPHALSHKHYNDLTEYLKERTAGKDITFLILDAGLKIAR